MFWLLVKALLGIVTLLVIVKIFHLADVLLSLHVLLDSGYLNPSHCGITLLTTITTLAQPRVLLVWPKSAQIKLEKLPTSLISGTKERRLINLNIFFKIMSPKRATFLGTPATYVLRKH